MFKCPYVWLQSYKITYLTLEAFVQFQTYASTENQTISATATFNYFKIQQCF